MKNQAGKISSSNVSLAGTNQMGTSVQALMTALSVDTANADHHWVLLPLWNASKLNDSTCPLLGSWASDGPGHVTCSFLSKGHKSEDFILNFLSEAGVHHAEWGLQVNNTGGWL